MNDEVQRRNFFIRKRQKERDRVFYLSWVLIIGTFPLIFINEYLAMISFIIGLIMFPLTFCPIKRWFGPWDEKDWVN